jgi:predicted DNA-binding transcriptional regulator AlpA
LEQKEYSQMALPIWDRITVPLCEFVELSGIGRSVAYQMMRSGELKSVTLGKKRMVVVASYRELLERSMAEQASYRPGKHRPGRPKTAPTAA